MICSRVLADLLELDYDEVKKIITEKTSDNAKEVVEEANKPLFTSEEEIMKLDEAYIREQATKAGILQKEREMILNLYKKKVPIETIAEYTNLSIDEVKKIVMGK